MDRVNWKSIKSELKRNQPKSDYSNTEFWNEFRKNAVRTPQDTTLGSSWIIGGRRVRVAVLAFIAVIIGILFIPKSSRNFVPTASKVKKVEVYASYSAMVIMEDKNKNSTMLWVSGIE